MNEKYVEKLNLMRNILPHANGKRIIAYHTSYLDGWMVVATKEKLAIIKECETIDVNTTLTYNVYLLTMEGKKIMDVIKSFDKL